MQEEARPPVSEIRYVPAAAEFLGLYRPHRSRGHFEWRPGLHFGDSLPWN
jgi:hypothetical protein